MSTLEEVVIGAILVAFILLLSLIAWTFPLWPLWFAVAGLLRAVWILAIER